MRIALVSSGWPEYTLLLANALSDLVSVHLFSPEDSFTRLSEFVKPAVNCHFHKSINFRSPENYQIIGTITDELKHVQPDALHFQGNIFWYAFWWREISRYPNLITIHDPWLHKGEWRLSNWVSLHLSIKLGDYFCVHGEYLKYYMVNNFQLNPENVYNVPHGEFSIYKHFLPPNVVEDEHAILFFGRIFPYKGLHVLIEAARKVINKFPNVTFIIAGSRGGSYARNLLRTVEGNKNFEIHHHYLSNEKVAELFERCSIVVLPYIDASQSGVIPIAFGFGKPVISTNVGSLSEVVKDGKNGLLVEPSNSSDLAQAIIKLLSDRNLRSKFGKAGLMETKTLLSWKNIARKYVDIYKIL